MRNTLNGRVWLGEHCPTPSDVEILHPWSKLAAGGLTCWLFRAATTADGTQTNTQIETTGFENLTFPFIPFLTTHLMPSCTAFFLVCNPTPAHLCSFCGFHTFRHLSAEGAGPRTRSQKSSPLLLLGTPGPTAGEGRVEIDTLIHWVVYVMGVRYCGVDRRSPPFPYLGCAALCKGLLKIIDALYPVHESHTFGGNEVSAIYGTLVLSSQPRRDLTRRAHPRVPTMLHVAWLHAK